jgi:hypothetical protein
MPIQQSGGEGAYTSKQLAGMSKLRQQNRSQAEVQSLRHMSVSMLLPSSHSSPGSITLLPQYAAPLPAGVHMKAALNFVRVRFPN